MNDEVKVDAEAALTIERAREIVRAINARAFVTMGMADELASLEGVSLTQMLEAVRMIGNANAARRAAAAVNGGGVTIDVTPDDRLIAAVYAIHHYPASREPILSIPAAGRRRRRCLAVVLIDEEPDGEDPNG